MHKTEAGKRKEVGGFSLIHAEDISFFFILDFNTFNYCSFCVFATSRTGVFFLLHISSMDGQNATQLVGNYSSAWEGDASRGIQIAVTLLIFLVRNALPEILYTGVMCSDVFCCFFEKRLHYCK